MEQTKLSKFINLTLGFYIGHVIYRSVIAQYINASSAMDYSQSLTSDRVIVPAIIAAGLWVLVDTLRKRKHGTNKTPSLSANSDKEAGLDTVSTKNSYLDELTKKIIENKDSTKSINTPHTPPAVLSMEVNKKRKKL